MNRILSLFDEQFVIDLFRREVLPQYPNFKDISRVVIRPYKNLVWETTYHVVLKFNTYFIRANGAEVRLPLVCSAHSEEPRENIFLVLKYLWAKDFPDESFAIPQPLFYSSYFHGTFYRGLEGENLLYYLKKRDWPAVNSIIAAAAGLYAKLHSLTVGAEANFNPASTRLETVIPGTAVIFREMGKRYDNKYNPDLEKIYHSFIAAEEKFFASGQPLVLIHGDAHPENIIRTGEQRVGLIDFTDFCLGDLARDLGSFLQQLEYKILKKIGDAAYAAQAKELFLSSYLAAAGRKLDADLQSRLDLYYNWTAMRTAIFWFLKFHPNAARAEELLNQVKANLNLGSSLMKCGAGEGAI